MWNALATMVGETRAYKSKKKKNSDSIHSHLFYFEKTALLSNSKGNETG